MTTGERYLIVINDSVSTGGSRYLFSLFNSALIHITKSKHQQMFIPMLSGEKLQTKLLTIDKMVHLC